ncbi:MAG: serine protease [Gammaproteobacteria bacterium]|nr:serine protease [Gammaproteobacteria bacterium]
MGAQTQLTEESAIELYLAGRELTPVEGIWGWADGSYEVVITKNHTGIREEYKYVGILIKSLMSGWRSGQIKILLNETEFEKVFTGIYFGSDQIENKTTFILTNPNLIETSPPVILYGSPLNIQLSRSYPSSATDSYASESSAGSGPKSGTCFLASPDGIVLTSQRVIHGMARITVRFVDGSQYPAEILQASISNDLAVLKVPVSGREYLPLAKPRAAETGDVVFTIGFPGASGPGAEPEFSQGTISAISGPVDEPTYMQVSLPMRAGNYGGPVVNEHGEVVGVVAATEAVEAFYHASASLPRNVVWVVKAEYAQLLFDPPPKPPVVTSSRQAIDQTAAAICQIVASD